VGKDPLEGVKPVATREEFLGLRQKAREVHVEKRVARYVRALVHRTRTSEDIALGVSPRGTLVLYRAAQARALMLGRDHVTPDDVQALIQPVLSHRVLPTERARYGGKSAAAILSEIGESVAVPA
jgi:MoxR-like ATPase